MADINPEISKDFFSRGTDALQSQRNALVSLSLQRARARVQALRADKSTQHDDAWRELECTVEVTAPVSTSCGDKRLSLPFTCASSFLRSGADSAGCEQLFVTGSEDSLVTLWNGPNGSPTAFGTRHLLRINDVHCFLTHERGLVASGSNDRTCCVWDVRGDALEHLVTLSGHVARVTRVRLVSHFCALTVSHDHTWRQWDIETGVAVAVHDSLSQSGAALDSHPDASLTAVGDLSGHSAVWDLRTGRQIVRLPNHSGPLTALHFDANHGQIFSGGGDGVLRCFDLRTNKPRYEIAAHSDFVTSIACCPSSSCVATSSLDGNFALWNGQGQLSCRVSSFGIPLRSLAFCQMRSGHLPELVTVGHEHAWKSYEAATPDVERRQFRAVGAAVAPSQTDLPVLDPTSESEDEDALAALLA